MMRPVAGSRVSHESGSRRIGCEGEIVGDRKAHHAIDLVQGLRRRIGRVGQHDEAIRQRVGTR